MLLMLVLGSVHAFSVFLEPLETELSATRSLTSATYSISLAALTISVLLAHRVFRNFKPWSVASALCLLAAGGCITASVATDIYLVWLTYGLVFGSANGIGYALSLQTAAQANPQHKGLAVGLITACYALGAAVAPYLFDLAIQWNGFSGAMIVLAGALTVTAPVAHTLFRSGNTRLEVTASGHAASDEVDKPLIRKLWLCYGTAVFGGLTIIGHATGVMSQITSDAALILLAPAMVALLNMTGSLSGGFLADRMRTSILLVVLPLLSALALVGLLFLPYPLLALVCLGLVGFAYGAIISVYPVSVSNTFGEIKGVAAYGRIFTAWGAAGLAGPVIAGGMYETFGGYHEALLLALASGLLSSMLVLAFTDQT